MSAVEGLPELEKKLAKLGNKVAGKVLRSAVGKATTKTTRKIRQSAPKGSVPHRTYKGRLVRPGFASRSVRKQTKIGRNRSSAYARIGVLAEAFYAVQFYDRRGRTPYTISTRRVSVGNGRKEKRNIKPYTLPDKPWFSRVFTSQERQMLDDLRKFLGQNIEKAARGN